MKPIWIVDDDRSIRWVLERALAKASLPCRAFAQAQEVLTALEAETPQVLVSDIRMPGVSGIGLLQTVKQRYPSLPVIIMTAFSDLDSAVALIRRAVDESLRDAGPDEPAGEVPEILGQAPAMHEVFRAIGRLSQSSVTVLITGESGTGKEVVARALHRHSTRADKPFIALNMAAIPRDLLESELFGHERGAFTGAQALRRGRFEQAEAGTLFLDEIGDMPAELQTRLLRVLSDGCFYRVGGHQPLRADVRVIAATHQNLDERVKQGLFREDLYHRLNVIRLRLPPLRERHEDIPLLARHFLARSARELGVETKRLSPEAAKRIAQLPFPGNVRQLENLCHWLTVLAPAQLVQVSDLPDEVQQAGGVPIEAAPTGAAPPAPPPAAAIPIAPPAASSADTMAASWTDLLAADVERLMHQGTEAVIDELTRDFESTVIRTALKLTQGRRIEAAARLGLGRNTITRKIQSLGLES